MSLLARGLVVVLVLALLPVSADATGWNSVLQQTPTVTCNPTAAVTPSSAGPGGRVTLTARGFVPGSSVRLSISGPSPTAPATTLADAGGSVVVPIAVELSDQAGTYTVSATGTCGGRSVTANASFTVIRSSGGGSRTVRPGGLWVQPNDGSTFGGSLHLEARAYPTNQGDPAIAYVNFTAQPTNGHWRVLCDPRGPQHSDVYVCDWTPGADIGAGPVQISFDVYDQAGNSNMAPHGTRSVSYRPGTPIFVCIGGIQGPDCQQRSEPPKPPSVSGRIVARGEGLVEGRVDPPANPAEARLTIESKVHAPLQLTVTRNGVNVLSENTYASLKYLFPGKEASWLTRFETAGPLEVRAELTPEALAMYLITEIYGPEFLSAENLDWVFEATTTLNSMDHFNRATLAVTVKWPPDFGEFVDEMRLSFSEERAQWSNLGRLMGKDSPLVDKINEILFEPWLLLGGIGDAKLRFEGRGSVRFEAQ